MTMTTILVPGRFHEHGLKRLSGRFDVLQVPDGDLTGLSDAQLSAVRAIAVSMSPIPAAMMERLPNLQVIANFGVGYDNVDVKAAVSRNILVTHTPNVLDDEVADTAIALLINTCRQLPRAERWLRDGRWERNGAFPLSPLTLRGRSIGILGMGRIGRTIAKRLSGFDVDVSYHNRRPIEGSNLPYHDTPMALAESVDTVISVLPGTRETEKLCDAAFFKALGPMGVFINVGRGSTVDELALVNALQTQTIAAAGLDVFAKEPQVPAKLLAMDNVVLLPHVASASRHTRAAMADLVVDNLIEWFEHGRTLTPVPECQAPG